MKKLCLIISAILLCYIGIRADEYGKIVLNPTLINNQDTPQANKILLNKLTRIITQNGMSGELLSPFIITANAVELDKSTTATAPPKTAVVLSLTIYIGNSTDGTLFSSCNMELRGVGDNLDQAYASAFKKINVSDIYIEQCVDQGKERILDYYESAAPDILRRAETLASNGEYADAYSLLLCIPSVCSQYDEAQSLIVKYARTECDNNNAELLSQARAAWSSSPNESGAAKAESLLNSISNPNTKTVQSMNALMKEISTRLQRVDDAERQLTAQVAANEHAERMALINGATKVAVAKAKNQPKVVYHIRWW